MLSIYTGGWQVVSSTKRGNTEMQQDREFMFLHILSRMFYKKVAP
jgi:hypothetical protein